MSVFELILMSISLAMDCFAVSCVVGLLQPQLDRKYVFRFTFSFGFFQGAMPLIGWLLGDAVLGLIGKFAPYIAFFILLFIGGKMLLESFKKEGEQSDNVDVTKLKNVILLSVATSIDALAVGFGFAMMGEPHLVRTIFAIFVASFIISLLGYNISRRISDTRITRHAEAVGGIILILIGLKIILF